MGMNQTLREIWLPDLLQLLQDHDGVLVLRQPNRPPLSLEIVGGRLGTVREGVHVLPLHKVEERLLSIMHAPQTTFRFYPDDLLPHAKGPKLSALAYRLNAMHRELDPIRHLLPQPNTRFQLVRDEALADPRWRELYERARPLLARGTSARELAERLELPLPVAQHFLFRLAQAKRVRPLAAAKGPRAVPFPGRAFATG